MHGLPKISSFNYKKQQQQITNKKVHNGVKLRRLKSTENIADINTKTLSGTALLKHRTNLNLQDIGVLSLSVTYREEK